MNSSPDINESLCHICLENKPLSFEHVPPRSANNNSKVFLCDMKNWLQRSADGQVKGKQFQRGAGVSTLCRDCNSFAGKWYVPDYTELVRVGTAALAQIPPEKRRMADEQIGVRIHSRLVVQDAKPLRVIKQIVTMMLAVSTVGFCEKHPDLREFVLCPDKQGLQPPFRLGLSLYLGPVSRYAAHEGILKTDTREFQFVTELALPPFSMVLMLNDAPLPDGHADVTQFANGSIDEVRDMPLEMDVRFGHTPYAIDFQSSAEKKAQREKNAAAPPMTL